MSFSHQTTKHTIILLIFITSKKGCSATSIHHSYILWISFLVQFTRQEINRGEVKVSFTFSKKRQRSKIHLASFPLVTATSSEHEIVLTTMESNLFFSTISKTRNTICNYNFITYCLAEINRKYKLENETLMLLDKTFALTGVTAGTTMPYCSLNLD